MLCLRVYFVFQEIENCGFVAWIDGETPDTAKRAVRKVWEMYHDSNSARITERIENAKLVKELSEEKNKWEKKYTDMVDSVNKFLDDTCRAGRVANYERIQQEGRDDDMKAQMQLTMQLLETQVSELKTREKEWDAEKQLLKEEKKKLEYNLFDVFKANIANKEKVSRIKAICEE